MTARAKTPSRSAPEIQTTSVIVGEKKGRFVDAFMDPSSIAQEEHFPIPIFLVTHKCPLRQPVYNLSISRLYAQHHEANNTDTLSYRRTSPKMRGRGFLLKRALRLPLVLKLHLQ